MPWAPVSQKVVVLQPLGVDLFDVLTGGRGHAVLEVLVVVAVLLILSNVQQDLVEVFLRMLSFVEHLIAETQDADTGGLGLALVHLTVQLLQTALHLADTFQHFTVNSPADPAEQPLPRVDLDGCQLYQRHPAENGQQDLHNVVHDLLGDGVDDVLGGVVCTEIGEADTLSANTSYFQPP